MSTFIVDAEGQVTLSKDILEHLGVHADGKIILTKLPGGRIELKAARPTGTISDVFGLLKRNDGTLLSVDEMNKIATRGWAGKRSDNPNAFLALPVRSRRSNHAATSTQISA